MKATTSKDRREPLSSVAILTTDKDMAIAGQPGWVEQGNLPQAVYWETDGSGVRLYDDKGTKIGDAATDSIVDFESYDRVFLLSFNQNKAAYTPHGVRPLARRPSEQFGHGQDA
jgi:hypothetical protein